jgi:uncharacterized membrane protein
MSPRVWSPVMKTSGVVTVTSVTEVELPWVAVTAAGLFAVAAAQATRLVRRHSTIGRRKSPNFSGDNMGNFLGKLTPG